MKKKNLLVKVLSLSLALFLLAGCGNNGISTNGVQPELSHVWKKEPAEQLPSICLKTPSWAMSAITSRESRWAPSRCAWRIQGMWQTS